MKKYISFWMILIITNAALAADAASISKGEPAPFDGFIITQDVADKARTNKIDLDTCNKITLSMQREIDLGDVRTERALKHMEELSKMAVKEPPGMAEKIGYFILGSIVTGAIAYGTVKTLR